MIRRKHHSITITSPTPCLLLSHTPQGECTTVSYEDFQHKAVDIFISYTCTWEQNILDSCNDSCSEHTRHCSTSVPPYVKKINLRGIKISCGFMVHCKTVTVLVYIQYAIIINNTLWNLPCMANSRNIKPLQLSCKCCTVLSFSHYRNICIYKQGDFLVLVPWYNVTESIFLKQNDYITAQNSFSIEATCVIK